MSETDFFNWLWKRTPLKVRAAIMAIVFGILGFFLCMMGGCASDAKALKNRVEELEYRVESDRLRVSKIEKKISSLVLPDHTDRTQSVGVCVQCPLCGSTRPVFDDTKVGNIYLEHRPIIPPSATNVIHFQLTNDR